MFKKILYKVAVFALSSLIALAAALSFSSAPAMAASETATYTVESVGFSNGFDLFYNATARNVPYYKYETVSNLSYGRAYYKVPLNLVIRNPGTTGYATGILAFNVSYNWDRQQGYSSGDFLQYVEFPVSHGEGYSWSYRPHSTYGGTVLVILDNYQLSSYGVPGPDWWLHLAIDMSNPIALGSTYDAYDFTAIANLNTLQVSSSSGSSLSDNISAAINGSTSIQNILTLLNAISSDTALLQSVVNKMDNISGVLANLYSQLQQGNSYLAGLGWALAGIDITAANGATVSQAVYDRWVDIIKSALDDQAPDTSEQETQIADQEDQLAQKEQLESEAFDFSNNNIASIDWNIDVPDQLAGAALVIMAMVSDIWDQLGILQFAVTAACTVGLVTIILGVVNRFSSIKARDSRRSARVNKSPGNENKTN